MKIKLYKNGDFRNFLHEFDNVEPFRIIEIDNFHELWHQPLLIDNKLYRVTYGSADEYKITEIPYMKID